MSTSGNTDTIEYSEEDEDPIVAFSWMNPIKLTEETNTCFIPPTGKREIRPDQAISRHVILQQRSIQQSSEKLKRCDFSYLPGVLFGKRISAH